MAPHLYPTYAPPALVFDRGEGCFLWTQEGERYLDCISGIAVNALGHAHPKAIAALREQADKLWHTSNMFFVPGQEALAQRYCDHSFADRVFFTNSGAEAVECALKTARRYHFTRGQAEKFRIITFEGAFHGRTYGAVNATGNPAYLEGFGPPMEGFDRVPFEDIDAVKAAITPQTGAIIIEPVQGEGGVRPASETFLKALRALCDEHGLLLIYDEVQAGAGRTGRLWAHQWFEGVEPDIMAIAKGVGGGFPMGACLAREEVAESMVIGTHGSTFGGNPLAMAVGTVVLDELMAPGMMEHVISHGHRLRTGLEALQDNHGDVVEAVRGKGLLLGLKLKEAVNNKKIMALVRDQHVLVGAAGDNVLRLAPPLILEQEHIDMVVEALDHALETGKKDL